ncbi:hypothetical protein [Kangiella sp. M94]
MNLDEELEQTFSQFLSGDQSETNLRRLVDNIDESDFETLINAVQELEDPSEYCKDDYDNNTVTGFFLFIDFISAVIINLGEGSIESVSRYDNSSHPYVPWVVKYVREPRFHDEIMAKFDKIFEA